MSNDAVDKLMVKCGDRLMPSKVWTRYQAKRLYKYQGAAKKGPANRLGGGNVGSWISNQRRRNDVNSE